MANEKIFNGRLRLKYDTHENWLKNDPVLLEGEVALAVVSVKQEGTVNTVPAVLLKVGDSTKKYSELGFTYARAADVIAAAKSEEALKAFVNTVIAEAGVATDEALANLSGKVTALEDKVGTETVTKQISDAINEANFRTTEYINTKAETTEANAKQYANSLHTSIDSRVTAIETALADTETFEEVTDEEINALFAAE